MDGADVTNVCRLCPAQGANQGLLSVFDERITIKNNMKEVILVTTGIEILESDIISKKICRKCCKNMQKIHDIVQAAIRQDQHLKEKCQQYLVDKGIRLPNTCITIKKDINIPSKTEEQKPVITEDTSLLPSKNNQLQPPQATSTPARNVGNIKSVHPTVIDVYRKYPRFKLPKRSLDRHLAPIVSLAMDEVEIYFKKRRLDLNKYIYRPTVNVIHRRINRVARKRTAAPANVRKILQNGNNSSVCSYTSSLGREIVETNGHNIQSKTTSLANENSEREKLLSPVTSFFPSAAPETPQNDDPVASPLNDERVTDNNTETKSSAANENPTISVTEASNVPINISQSAAAPTDKDPSIANTTKPEFIQSLGLTPALAGTTKRILICKICAMVHPNVASLKKHSSRHRVCPYCRLKCKSVERKQNHIDLNCEVKQIIESPESFVSLEKVECNLKIREQYKKLFTAVGLIPGQNEPDEVIVLSDGESQCENDIQEITEVPAPESPKMESVSIVRPIVIIQDNTMLIGLKSNLSERQFIKELICRLRKKQPTTIEQVMQSVQPSNKDIVPNRNNTCKLKNLKASLWAYIVPVTLKDGDFKISYATTAKSKPPEAKADWNDLPLSEKWTKNTSQEIPLMNTTYPLTFVASQVQSSPLSLPSIQLMATTPTMSFILPNTSAFIPGAGLSLQQGINNTVNQTQAINNTFFSPSLQTAPLLQNYTLSMTPVPIINNQVSIQSQSNVTSTVTSNDTAAESAAVSSTADNSVSSTSSVVSSTTRSSSKKSLPSSSKSRKMTGSPRRLLPATSKSSSKIKITSKRQMLKGKTASTTASSKSSKLRVRNIWEMK